MTATAATQPALRAGEARDVLPPPGPLRRAVNLLIAACGVGFVLGGLALVVDYRLLVVPDQQHYLNAPACAQPVLALSTDCYVELHATVTAVGETYSPNGAPHWSVWLGQAGDSLTLPPTRYDVALPTNAFHALRPGDPATLKIYHGRATFIQAQPPSPSADMGGIRLVDHPLADEGLQLAGGGSLVAMGAVLLVLVLPTTTPSGRFIRWFGNPGAPSLWSGPPQLVRAVLADRLLLGAFLVLLLLQALDVVSSVAGNASGLSEANPINLAMLEKHGNAGFLAVKLPAVIALLLIMGRMPRRLALLLAWLANAAMIYVVVSNLLLVNQQPTS